MVEPPEGLKLGISVDILPNGHIRTHIINEGHSAVHFDCLPADAGRLATALMVCSYEIAKAAGISPVASATPDYQGPLVGLTRLRLAQSQMTDHEILVLGAGAAEMGFAIPHTELEELGQVFLTASAGGKVKN
jgi:hypothetical protein